MRPPESSSSREAYWPARVRSCIAARTVRPASSRSASISSSASCWRPASSALVGSSRREQRRVLGERPGEHRPLALAARERAELPVGEVGEIEPGERLLGRGEIAPALTARVGDVRRPPEQHVLAHRHPRRHHRHLRNDGDAPRELAPGEPPDRLAVQRDRAVVAHEPGDRAQQRRLPRAVRADQRHPLAVLDRERDAVDDRAAAQLDRDVIESERGHDDSILRDVRSTTAKNGAPKNAVTTPIGSSAGESAVRAITSASTRKPAPISTDSGSSSR